jgi:hypothetical protein
MELNQFLIYLGGAGAIAVISWLFEDWPWFQSLVGKTKQIVFFLACVAIALGSQAIVTFVAPAMLALIAPWFATVSAIFAYVFFGSEIHNKTKLDSSDK